jgi:spore germination protein GerM
VKSVPPKSEPAKTTTAKPKNKTAAEENKATRDRMLWFVRVESDGVIARVKVKRSISASDTPLVDALNAVMSGPNPEEKKKGVSSLIPAGTKLLSATVRGSTAYLSFNEQFQFNSYGIEGYAAQLRQIVWTATEFESVKDVQILIEGRRVDYLGSEGIFIGSPLTRDSI